MTSTLCFTASPSSLSFIAAASPCLAPHSVLSKVCACARQIERHKENASVCKEEKLCVAVYADGTSHSSVCPGFDTVQVCCKSRANEDSV